MKKRFCFWFPVDLLINRAELDGGFVLLLRPPPPSRANALAEGRLGQEREQENTRYSSVWVTGKSEAGAGETNCFQHWCEIQMLRFSLGGEETLSLLFIHHLQDIFFSWLLNAGL